MPSPDDLLRTPSPAPAAGSPASMPERPAPQPPVFDTSAPSDANEVASGAGQIQDKLRADEKAAAEARRQREVQLKSAGVAVVRAFDQYALGDGSVASQRGPVAAAQILGDRWAEAHNIAGGVTARVDFDRNGDFHLRLFRKTDGFPVTDFDFAKMKASLQEGHYLDEHDEQLRQQLGITPAATETPSASLTFNQFAEQLLKLPRAMWDDYARNIGAAGLFYDGDENKMQETFTKLDAQAAAPAKPESGIPSGWDFYGAFDAAMAGPGATKASMLGRLDAALDAGLINQEHYDALSEMLENRDWTSPSASSAPTRTRDTSASASSTTATDAGVSASAGAPFDEGASFETPPPNGTGANDAPAAVDSIGSAGAEPGKEPTVDERRAEAAYEMNLEPEDMEWDTERGAYRPKRAATPWSVESSKKFVTEDIDRNEDGTISLRFFGRGYGRNVGRHKGKRENFSDKILEESIAKDSPRSSGYGTAVEILSRMGFAPGEDGVYTLTKEQYDAVMKQIDSGRMPPKPQASEPPAAPEPPAPAEPKEQPSEGEPSAEPPAADPLAEPAKDKNPAPTSENEPEPVEEPEEPTEEPAEQGKPAPVMVGGRDLSDPAKLAEFEQKMQQQGYRVREIDGENYLWHPKAKVWIGSDGHTMTSEGGIYREDQSGKLRWKDHEESIPKDMLAYLRFKNGQTEDEAKNLAPVDENGQRVENAVSSRSQRRIDAFENGQNGRQGPKTIARAFNSHADTKGISVQEADEVAWSDAERVHVNDKIFTKDEKRLRAQLDLFNKLSEDEQQVVLDNLDGNGARKMHRAIASVLSEQKKAKIKNQVNEQVLLDPDTPELDEKEITRLRNLQLSLETKFGIGSGPTSKNSVRVVRKAGEKGAKAGRKQENA